MLSEKGIFDKGLKIRSMILPDQFIDQDTPENMYKIAGLDAQSIEQKALDALKSNIVIPKTKQFN
jgi:1-deoxy-D-xylulose-5-phosphate synthase